MAAIMSGDSGFSTKIRIALMVGWFCLLVVVGGQPWLSSAEAKEPAKSKPGLVAYFVSWHKTEHGSSSRSSDSGMVHSDATHSMNMEMTGSAIIRYRAGTYFDIHFLTVTRRLNDTTWIHRVTTFGNETDDCTITNQYSIIDPGAYSGFHADAATSGMKWELLGTWGEGEPDLQASAIWRTGPTHGRLEGSFASLGNMRFTVRYTHEESGTCNHPGARESLSFLPTDEAGTPPGKHILEADSADRTSFSVNQQFTYIQPSSYNRGGSDEKRYVTWTGHAYRMGKCAAHDGPIPETDPTVQNEDVHISTDDSDITPDGKTKVHVRVTCDGTPVEGANVEIKVEPGDSSGGHIHVNNRPKGKLNGTDLTSANPSITLPTDENGTVKGPNGITFAPPGKAPISRCLGLAGLYKVTATSKKFSDRQDSTMITVELKNLPMLPPPQGQNYDICADSVYGCSKEGPWGTGDHPDSEYGTAGTIQAFQNVATDFWNRQGSHNDLLQHCEKPPWPQIKVSFNDIALPWGGLFDMNSTWKQPHKTHGRGQGGDFNHFKNNKCKNANGQVIPCLSCGGATVNLDTFLWNVLKSTAQPKYGHWDGEVNSSGELHLHVEDQGQGPPSDCPADD